MSKATACKTQENVSAAQKAFVRLTVGTCMAPHQSCHELMSSFVEEARKDSSFVVPSEWQLKQVLIPRMASSIESAIKDSVGAAESVSLGFDIWSRNHRGFIGITSHAIAGDFNPVCKVLGLFEFNDSHTGENIIKKIRESVSRFNIRLENVVAMTHDAASNNHSRKALQATPGIIRILCGAHKANSAVKFAFKTEARLAATLDTFQGLCKVFRRAPQAARQLALAQMKHYGRTIVYPSVGETRFNGGYILLRAMSKQQAAIEEAITVLNQPAYKDTYKFFQPHLPAFDSFLVCEQMVKVLEPVNEFMTSIQARGTTLAELIVQLAKFYKSVTILEQGRNPFVNVITQSFMRYFPTDIYSSKSVFMVCCALDVRTCHRLREFMSRKPDRKALWAFVTSEIVRLYGATTSDRPAQEYSDDSSSSGDDIAEVGASDADTLVRREVRKFKSAIQSASTETDNVAWWRKHNTKFPTVAMYARRIFSIQATECENERQFSSSGLLFLCFA